jgi:hypothetical protein
MTGSAREAIYGARIMIAAADAQLAEAISLCNDPETVMRLSCASTALTGVALELLNCHDSGTPAG